MAAPAQRSSNNNRCTSSSSTGTPDYLGSTRRAGAVPRRPNAPRPTAYDEPDGADEPAAERGRLLRERVWTTKRCGRLWIVLKRDAAAQCRLESAASLGVINDVERKPPALSLERSALLVLPAALPAFSAVLLRIGRVELQCRVLTHVLLVLG